MTSTHMPWLSSANLTQLNTDYKAHIRLRSRFPNVWNQNSQNWKKCQAWGKSCGNSSPAIFMTFQFSVVVPFYLPHAIEHTVIQHSYRFLTRFLLSFFPFPRIDIPFGTLLKPGMLWCRVQSALTGTKECHRSSEWGRLAAAGEASVTESAHFLHACYDDVCECAVPHPATSLSTLSESNGRMYPTLSKHNTREPT